MVQLAPRLGSEVRTGECLKAVTLSRFWTSEQRERWDQVFFFFSRNANKLARMLWEREGRLWNPQVALSSAVMRVNIEAVFLWAVPAARFMGLQPSQTGLPAVRDAFAPGAPGRGTGLLGQTFAPCHREAMHLCGREAPAEKPSPLFPRKAPWFVFSLKHRALTEYQGLSQV